MPERLSRELLDRINQTSAAERARLVTAATRVAASQAPIGLQYRPEDRVRDLERGVRGVVLHAGRDERTGWELYRVRLEDGSIVFRTDRQLTRDRVAASGAERAT